VGQGPPDGDRPHDPRARGDGRRGCGHHHPADLAILRHPDFQALEHSTKWVEEKLDLSASRRPEAAGRREGDDARWCSEALTVEVNGKRFDVKMWVPDVPMVAAGPAKAAPRSPDRVRALRRWRRRSRLGQAVEVPMQGTIVKVLVEVGQEVEAGQAVCVLEAMKMENNGDVVIVITPAAKPTPLHRGSTFEC
jgi:acetyl-CoA/propionyl-CoA carboxylase biotin carboxyl carrier protein